MALLAGLLERTLRVVAEAAEMDFSGAVALAGVEGESTVAVEGSERGNAGVLANGAGA